MSNVPDGTTPADLASAASDVRAAAEIYNNTVEGAQALGLIIQPVFVNGAKVLIQSVLLTSKY